MSKKLTGKTKYRSQFITNKLILQVEYEYSETIMLGPYFDTYTVKKWKDATFEDLQVLYNRKVDHEQRLRYE